jgi:uracil phosphoribosyltransferase
MTDAAYNPVAHSASEIEHDYPPNVHILSDPVALSQLARLCHEDCTQPEFNRLIKELYRVQLRSVVNAQFPRTAVEQPTRMQDATPRGVWSGEVIDPATTAVTVDVARAGILPSEVCFETLTGLLEPSNVRQDHVVMSRVTDEQGNVTGATINGDKAGESVDGRIVLLPDPMGATGSSMDTAIEYYKEEVDGEAAQIIVMHLMITPEYIRRITDNHPDVHIYALRLDRGMSPDDVLETRPGERWDEESGLTDNDYIVPGGGGFGELMNNAWV